MKEVFVCDMHLCEWVGVRTSAVLRVGWKCGISRGGGRAHKRRRKRTHVYKKLSISSQEKRKREATETVNKDTGGKEGIWPAIGVRWLAASGGWKFLNI